MRTIGMDHARQKRTQPRGFRVHVIEKVLIALGVFLSVGSLIAPSIRTMDAPPGESETPGLGALAPGLVFIVPALVSLVVRYTLYRRGRSAGAR